MLNINNEQVAKTQVEFGKLLTPAKLATFSNTSLLRLIEINDGCDSKFLPDNVVVQAQQKPKPDDLPIAQAVRTIEDYEQGQIVMLKSINVQEFIKIANVIKYLLSGIHHETDVINIFVERDVMDSCCFSCIICSEKDK